MHPALHRAFEFLIHHGLAVLFGWVLVEQLGVPIPAMPLLLAAGGLSGAGGFYFFSPPFFSWVGAFILGSLLFFLGRPQGVKNLHPPFPDFPGTGLLRAANTRNVFQARSTLAPGGQVFARFGISYAAACRGFSHALPALSAV